MCQPASAVAQAGVVSQCDSVCVHWHALWVNLLALLHRVSMFPCSPPRYIVLEFVENGSLAQMLKRFGSFPETLTAVYVCQVLNGLAFLHKQGVIHRDIKVRV